jgi:hypothetical protein
MNSIKRPILLLVVHGMGKQAWLPHNVACLKACIETIQTDQVQLTQSLNDFPPPDIGSWDPTSQWILGHIGQVTVVPVDYHSALHTLPSADPKMQSIRLPTASRVRDVINDYLMDPFYYATPFHGTHSWTFHPGIL